jgi:hypothetical protein
VIRLGDSPCAATHWISDSAVKCDTVVRPALARVVVARTDAHARTHIHTRALSRAVHGHGRTQDRAGGVV